MHAGLTKLPERLRLEIAPRSQFLHLLEQILALFRDRSLLIQQFQCLGNKPLRRNIFSGFTGNLAPAEDIVDLDRIRNLPGKLRHIVGFHAPELFDVHDAEIAQGFQRFTPVPLQAEQSHFFHFHYHAAVS